MSRNTAIVMSAIVTPVQTIDRPTFPIRASSICGGIVAAFVAVTMGNVKLDQWKAERVAIEQQRQWQESDAKRQAEVERQRRELMERQQQAEAQRQAIIQQQREQTVQPAMQPAPVPSSTIPVPVRSAPPNDAERQQQQRATEMERAQRELVRIQAEAEAKMKAAQPAPATASAPAKQGVTEKPQENNSSKSSFRFSLSDLFKSKGE